mgnify:CR=1 FL=1
MSRGAERGGVEGRWQGRTAPALTAMTQRAKRCSAVPTRVPTAAGVSCRWAAPPRCGAAARPGAATAPSPPFLLPWVPRHLVRPAGQQWVATIDITMRQRQPPLVLPFGRHAPIVQSVSAVRYPPPAPSAPRTALQWIQTVRRQVQQRWMLPAAALPTDPKTHRPRHPPPLPLLPERLLVHWGTRILKLVGAGWWWGRGYREKGRASSERQKRIAPLAGPRTCKHPADGLQPPEQRPQNSQLALHLSEGGRAAKAVSAKRALSTAWIAQKRRRTSNDRN